MNPRILLILLLALVLLGVGVFLATREIAAPRHVTEKVLPNDRFFK